MGGGHRAIKQFELNAGSIHAKKTVEHTFNRQNLKRSRHPDLLPCNALARRLNKPRQAVELDMRFLMPWVLLAGCQAQTPVQKPPTPPTKPAAPVYGSGDHAETVDEGKVARGFTVRVPPNYDGKRLLPVVVLLHGWTSSAKRIETLTGMDKKSDAEGFLLIVPDGLGNPQGWNCGFFNLGGKDANDVKFISDALDAAGKKVKIDPRRVFVAGHSNGAMMAYTIGAKLSKRIAAIGVVSGTAGIDQGEFQSRVDPPTSPVSALIIHGLLDPTVPYNHGKALLQNCMSAPDSALFWARADGIESSPTRTTAANDNVEQLDWRGDGVEVKLISIANGTHDWPGGVNWDGDEKSSGINATDQLWAFFAHHPKRVK